MNDVRFALSIGFLAPRHLKVHRVKGRETLSDTYVFDIEVTATLPPEIFERALLARRGRFAIRAGGKFRCIHGLVAAIEFLGVSPRATDLFRYRVRLVPRAWLARKRTCSRIFQRLRVREVVDAVLGDHGADTRWQIEDELPARDYTTQYEETDWAFVRRLAAENGLFFYFDQPPTVVDEAIMAALDEASAVPTPFPLAEVASLFVNELVPMLRETVVFADKAHYLPIRDGSVMSSVLETASTLGLPVQHTLQIGPIGLSIQTPSPSLHYRDSGALVGTEEAWVSDARLVRSLRTTGSAYREYDWRRPLTPIDGSDHISPLRSGRLDAGLRLELSPTAVPSLALDGVTEALDGLLEPEQLEAYDHEGHDLYPDWERRAKEAERILRAGRRRSRIVRGTSPCIRLEPGHRFRLEGHPLDLLNSEFAVVSVRHEGVQAFGDAAQATPYRVTFECVPSRVAYLPKRPKRRSVQVSLTATVVGPGTEEIHVNERGEIKVKFHWDRDADREDSSCWIRTMHPWAGAGWGFQFIPRVGMEVVVTFEGGDPDKPLVLGCVYNGVLPPPFALPADKTVSGIRTRSTPNAEGHNELSFRDAAQNERIYLHAQRDWDSLVERNRTATIQHDDALLVRGTQTKEIVGDRSSTMRHDDHLRVEGTRHVSVQQNLDETVYGNRTVHVHERDYRQVTGDAEDHVRGDLVARVDGNATLLVGKHDEQRSATVVVEGPIQVAAEKVLDLVSEKEVIIRCGQSFIRIGPREIEIASPKVIARGKDARLLLAEGMAKTKTKTGYQVVSDGGIALQAEAAGIRIKNEVVAQGARICLNAPTHATDNIEINEVTPTKVEIKDQEGQPIPYQRFRIICDDGSEYMGFVDEDGNAEADIEQGGKIVFPDLSDVEEG